jgi:tRNA modification GTPase
MYSPLLFFLAEELLPVLWMPSAAIDLISFRISGIFGRPMQDKPLALHDPIAALATPWGKSAIAVVRASGEGVIGLVDRLFSGAAPLRDRAGFTLAHGFLSDPAGGETIDEVLAAVFRAPHSYTGDDAVELSLHGGLPTIARALDLLRRSGFRDAAPGEFTLRAFTNGKLDLCAAEAVNDIVNAESDRARSLAFARLSGALRDRIDAVKGTLADILAGVEAMIDYPDETYEHAAVSRRSLEAALEEIDALLATYRAGRTFQEGAAVAVAGRTNAGKSTLFNLLLKEDRSIVSTVPGTTRDFIEGAITVAGIPIRLFDTAGLRAAGDALEAEGIRRARAVLERADLVIYLVDAGPGLAPEDREFLEAEATARPLIRLWTKVDADPRPAPVGFIPVSALDGTGLGELEQAISRALLGDFPSEGQAVVIDSLRQKEALERTRRALAEAAAGLDRNGSYDLLAADLREALDALGSITGEVTSQDILDLVFSKFCVGK